MALKKTCEQCGNRRVLDSREMPDGRGVMLLCRYCQRGLDRKLPNLKFQSQDQLILEISALLSAVDRLLLVTPVPPEIATLNDVVRGVRHTRKALARYNQTKQAFVHTKG